MRAAERLTWALSWGAFELAQLGCSSVRAARPAEPPLAVRPLVVVATDPVGRAGRAMVALRPESRADEARRAVRTFFVAIAQESLPLLKQVLTDEAQVVTQAGAAAEPIGRLWESRFRRFEYSDALVPTVQLDRRVAVFSAPEAEALRSARNWEMMPRGEQVLAVAELGAPGSEVDLPERIELLLEPTTGGYRIARCRER